MGKKLTFFDRFLGVPHKDKISNQKYILKIIKYILIILGICGTAAYYSYTNINNRTTSFTSDVESSIIAPTFHVFFFPNQIEYIFWVVNFSIKKNSNEVLISCKKELDLIILPFKCVSYETNIEYYIDPDEQSFAYFENENFKLKESDTLSIELISMTTANEPVDVFIGVNFESYYIDTSQQASIGLSKKIIIKDGEKNDKFLKTVSTSKSMIVAVPNTKFKLLLNTHNIYFTSNVVLTENTQSNFEIVIEILSSIGSVISIILLACGIIISTITKLIIRDKSGWIDQDLHECITYHYDQVNLQKLEIFKNNLKTNDENDHTVGVDNNTISLQRINN